MVALVRYEETAIGLIRSQRAEDSGESATSVIAETLLARGNCVFLTSLGRCKHIPCAQLICCAREMSRDVCEPFVHFYNLRTSFAGQA